LRGISTLAGPDFTAGLAASAPGLLGAGDVGAPGGAVLEGFDVFRGLGHGKKWEVISEQ
jgi:hypothetical protein